MNLVFWYLVSFIKLEMKQYHRELYYVIGLIYTPIYIEPSLTYYQKLEKRIWLEKLNWELSR